MDSHDEFLPLFLRHEGELRAFIGSVLRDRSAREDVLQETALVLWREFDRYDRNRSFGAWARGIAVNKLRQRLDREGRMPTLLPADVLPALAAAYDRTAEGSGGAAHSGAARSGAAHSAAAEEARRQALDACLAELPEKSRALLGLRYEQGLTLQQAADRIHSTIDAVHKALSRLRVKLQACIERRLRLGEES